MALKKQLDLFLMILRTIHTAQMILWMDNTEPKKQKQ